MSKALVLPDAGVNLELWGNIAYAMSGVDGDSDITVPSVTWVSERFGITKREALQAIAHPKFATFFHNLQKAIARNEFDRVAFKKLVEDIKDEKSKSWGKSIKLLAELVGYKESAPMIVQHFSLERAVKKTEGVGEVIEAEFTELPGL
jgi:hypothetical protein